MAQDTNDLSNVEIEPLSDEALEEVAGGSTNSCCSCSGCSSPPPDQDAKFIGI